MAARLSKQVPQAVAFPAPPPVVFSVWTRVDTLSTHGLEPKWQCHSLSLSLALSLSTFKVPLVASRSSGNCTSSIAISRLRPACCRPVDAKQPCCWYEFESRSHRQSWEHNVVVPGTHQVLHVLQGLGPKQRRRCAELSIHEIKDSGLSLRFVNCPPVPGCKLAGNTQNNNIILVST